MNDDWFPEWYRSTYELHRKKYIRPAFTAPPPKPKVLRVKKRSAAAQAIFR